MLDGGGCSVSGLVVLASKKQVLLAVVHTFNLSTWKGEAGRSLEFEASLVYKVESQVSQG